MIRRLTTIAMLVAAGIAASRGNYSMATFFMSIAIFADVEK